MIGRAVSVFLLPFYRVILGGLFMSSVLMRVQGQNQLSRNNNPAEEQEHEINGNFPE